MSKKSKYFIPFSEIDDFTQDMYHDYTDEIIGKSNPLDGERNFILSVMEQIAGLLNRSTKNDKMIILHIQTLLRASLSKAEYTNFLSCIFPSKLDTCKNLNSLSTSERAILNELMQSNYHEYLMKSDYESCCYTAMYAFLITAYCIISKGITDYVSQIDITVDIYDTVEQITLTLSESKTEHIYVDWHGINKINDLYMLYLTQYPWLEKSSILDLVSADVIEKEYYSSDDRFTIAPSILMKQYLAIIEREVNEIMQLSNLPTIQQKHYDWYDMKNIVRKRGINIDYLPFKLYKALDDLYKYRNGSMHGETDITHEDSMFYFHTKIRGYLKVYL